MSPRQRKRGDHRLTSNYSEIPNCLYDEWIPALNRAGYRGHGDVLGVIARQTLGWRDLVHQIGTPELAKFIGIEQSRVLEILNELEAMGAIVRERRGNGRRTALGLRLDWKADDESLARGNEVRQERIEKDRARRRQKAKHNPEPEGPNLTRQRVRSAEEPDPSTGQVTWTVNGSGNLDRQRVRSDEAEKPEKPVNTRPPGVDAERLKKRKERKETDSENQSISPLSEGETSPEPTDRPTSGGKDSSPSEDWRTAESWRAINVLVDEQLGAAATDEARDLGARVEGLVGRRIPRSKLDALAGVVGSGGEAALVEAARRYETRSGIKSPWPYLLQTLLSAAEDLGDEAAASDPARAPEGAARRADDGADDGSGLRADLEAALGRALPRMLSGARLTRDEKGRKTVVARDGAHGRSIEKSWGSDLDDAGWRLIRGDEGSPQKKGEVA